MPDILIRRIDGQYATAREDGSRTWTADKGKAFRYLAHSGLLAWDLRDITRRGERADIIEAP